MFRTWSVRLPASVFTFSVRSFQTPETPSTWAWPPSRPSVPTSFATRVTSAENERSWSTIVLMVSFSSSTSPLTSTVIFFERSPLATAVVTAAMLRTCEVRLPASVFTFSVRSFQTPETPLTWAWPPRLAVRADLAGDAGDLVGEARELVDHRVDGVLQLEHLALDVDGDLLREVAVRDRGRHLGDVAHLAGQVRRHLVDRVGQVLPGPGDALDARLAAELALGADLARDARDLVGEARELVDHPVHGRADAAELAADRLPVDLELDPLPEVAVGDRVDHARDLDRRPRQVVDQLVDRADLLRPRAGRPRDACPLGDPTLTTHDLAHPHELARHLLVSLDERVERRGDVSERAVRAQPHREIALGGGLERVQEPA